MTRVGMGQLGETQAQTGCHLSIQKKITSGQHTRNSKSWLPYPPDGRSRAPDA
jgi:hypothetical protein